MVDKSEKFSWLVRLGYAARGLLYLVIGYLALTTAHHDKSQRGAMAYVDDTLPAGGALLYAIAAGLVAYAAFKLLSCLFDVERHGSDAKGLAVRAVKGGGAVIYAALAWSAFELANGHRKAASSGAGVQHAAGTLLSFSFGPLVLGLVGLGFVGGAAGQVALAITAKFMRRISNAAPKVVEYAGRAGHAARAVVFGVIGWSLMQSAWWHHGVRVRSLGDAVDALSGHPALYTVLAVGLMPFGFFSLLVGYYRIIPDIDKKDLKPRIR